MKTKEDEIINIVKHILFSKIDWIEVFKEAYESRKTSWYGLGHIKEWRNATDEVLFAMWRRFENEFLKLKQEQTK